MNQVEDAASPSTMDGLCRRGKTLGSQAADALVPSSKVDPCVFGQDLGDSPGMLTY